MHTRAQRNGLSLIETLVVIAIISLLIGIILPGVQRVRASAAKAQCQSNLHQIGLALTNYHSAHGQLPIGVTIDPEPQSFALMSWHVRLLPFLELEPIWQQALYAFSIEPNDFTKSPPHPFTTVIPVYGCPSDGRLRETALTRGGLPVALASYLGVDGTRGSKHDGILFGNSHVTFMDITDGTSSTLLVGERPPSTDLWYGWWYAGWGTDQHGTADTVLGTRERATPMNDPLVTDCGKGFTSYRPGQINSMCDAMHFWSLHSGGANFLFADGAVHFLPYSLADIMPALGTRAGGEAVTVPD